MAHSVDPVIKKRLTEDGVVKVRGMLDADQIAHAKACFDWTLANPSPRSIDGGEGEGNVYRIDNDNPNALEVYADLVKALPIADTLAEVWESEHVWFKAEEIFWKKGDAPRTVWHQDVSYSPWNGEHVAGAWICFDAVPKSHSLEVIRGSHRGPIYDGSAFDPEDPTIPLWGDRLDPPLPRLPDIEKERRAKPDSWDIVSHDIEIGDVILVHPASLHAGAPVDEQFRERRTLVLRFFGDKMFWSHHVPDEEDYDLNDDQSKAAAKSKSRRGEDGSLYRPEKCLQLR